MQDALSWVVGNLLWEVLMALIGTSMARMWRATTGKIKTKKMEAAFWTVGIVGGTMILALINSGFVSPMVSKFTKPNFSWGDFSISLMDNGPRTHGIKVDLTLFNEGAPSVIRNWQLKISGPNNEIIIPPVIRYYVPFNGDAASMLDRSQAIGITIDPDGKTNAYFIKDSFLEEAGNTPIERGGKRVGYLLFEVTNVSRAFLESPETKYNVSFWDISSHKYDLPEATVPPPQR